MSVIDVLLHSVPFTNALYDIAKASTNDRDLSDFERSLLEMAFLGATKDTDEQVATEATAEALNHLQPSLKDTLESILNLRKDEIWNKDFFTPSFENTLVQSFFSVQGKYDYKIENRVIFPVPKLNQQERRFLENFKSSLFQPSEAYILEVPVEAVEQCVNGTLNVVHHFDAAPNVIILVNESGE